MQDTRQGILDYLHSHHQAAPLELSRSLQVTAANIRHHLSILLAEGLILAVGRTPPAGRGRPRQLYALNPATQAHNLAQLASALLASLPAQQREEKSRSIARRLSQDMPDLHPNPTQRLYQAVQQLNALQYRARWEARASGPQVRLEHCPYALLLAEHGELCQLDRYLVERSTGFEVEQTARMKTGVLEIKACVFALKLI